MDPRKIKKEIKIELLPCLVCNTPFFMSYNSHNICWECFWHDDYVPGYHHPDEISGANQMSLNEARENYKNHGISDLKMMEVKERLKRYRVKSVIEPK